MGLYLNENGYVCFVRSGVPLADTHGGYADQHRQEQEEIINDIVDQKIKIAMDAMKEAINRYAADVWSGLISSLKGALNRDIVSEVTIAFNNADDIFHGKKAQEYVVKHMYDALDKELNKLRSIKIEL